MAQIRARIGYTSVAFVTEIFPMAFYDIVPDGVVLSFLTMQQMSSTGDEMKRIHGNGNDAAPCFVRAGCDVVILGGAPTNLSHGSDSLTQVLEGMAGEFGIPVSSSASAQNKALLTLGAKNVGVVHPAPQNTSGRHDRQLIEIGMIPSGSLGAGAELEDYNRIPKEAALTLGRELKRDHPELDTLLFTCPHWAQVHAIEPLEAELGINVVTSLQAITWDGLRLAGIDDPIDGYGRLLRDH
jgi:maleate isomerase